MKKILFVCIHNSARSQMAEAFLNSMNLNVTADSAGIEKGSLNPLVVEVMKEVGIDISGNTSKTVSRNDRGKVKFMTMSSLSAIPRQAKDVPYFPVRSKKGFTGRSTILHHLKALLRKNLKEREPLGMRFRPK